MIITEGNNRHNLILEDRFIQKQMAITAEQIIRRYNLVYLAAQERVGKSLPALIVASQLNKSSVLIFSTKKALIGWQKLIETYLLTNKGVIYELSTYQSAHKVILTDCDIIILDEAHALISGYPKRSKTWKKIHQFTVNKPLIFISATPHAQGGQLLYNQFALSNWSPWKKYKNFYAWYQDYAKLTIKGDFKRKFFRGLSAIDYTAVQNDRIFAKVEKYFVRATRKEADLKFEPKDQLHFIKLSKPVRDSYNYLIKHKVLVFILNNKIYTVRCDTVTKLRLALHMLEGGTLKIEKDYLILSNDEKIRYIHNKWGDLTSLIIMYHYKAEGKKLRANFKNAAILQATSNAEGIDLYQYDNLVIYSQDFSTARYSQRRARQVNKLRKKPIAVHFLLVKDAISQQVYNTVAINKQNFIDSRFILKEI
jgi:hypothetical protein